MQDFGYKKKQTTSSKTESTRLVRYIVLGEGFPQDYLKEAEYPSHKEGGLALKYAVIATNDGSGWHELPEPEVKTMLQRTPEYIYNKNISFGHVARGGAKGENGKVVRAKADGRVIIDDILPNSLPAKDFASGKVATKLTEDEKAGQFKELWQQETERIQAWREILQNWQTLGEDEATELLQSVLSLRLLIYEHRDGDFYYDLPRQGMILEAKEGNYGDLIAFDWNKEAKKFDYYSNGITSVDYAKAESILSVAGVEEEVPF